MAYSTAEYPIGGGIVYIGPFTGTTPPDDGDWLASAGGFDTDYGDFVDLGAVPDVSVAMVADIVEHYQIRDGIEGLDAQDVTKVGETWKFTCDQVNKDTLAMFFLGAVSGNNMVLHLTVPTQEFGLKVVPNYTRGQKWIHEAWRGMLKPAGDFKLFTGREYGKVDFEFTLLNDATNHPTGSPWGLSTLPS
jgi:hypothetical protein